MYSSTLLALILGLAFNAHLVVSQGCDRRFFSSDSFVCVCSDAYCDYVGEIQLPAEGTYTRIVSSRDEFRFDTFSGAVDTAPAGNVNLVFDPALMYQTILGFGGAFTDATGINVVSLSQNLQDAWLRSHFAPEGIEYDLCRVPIAGSDFSTYAYSYDEVVGDVALDFFALTQEDYLYKIPLIQKAMEMSNQEIRLFGSPWSPPPWMKENGMHNGTGGLLREMWDPFAEYLVKFVQAYESNGLPIWGITPQNEPLTGFSDWAWNTCAWSAEDMRDWIKTSMGPIFGAAGLRRVNVMVLDHNRDVLPSFPATILSDPEAYQYVDGTAVHWYADETADPELLTETSQMFPDKFLLYTESCEGWHAAPDQRVVLGSWQRAENYAANILEDLDHYVTGWVDWNMALDLGGGPNWANNFVDSPTIVNAGTQEFYKQPMFYALGHFSKFIKVGAMRVGLTVEGDTEVKAVAFHVPDATDTHNVVVVLNTGESVKQVSINHEGTYVNFDLNPKSIETILF